MRTNIAHMALAHGPDAAPEGAAPEGADQDAGDTGGAASRPVKSVLGRALGLLAVFEAADATDTTGTRSISLAELAARSGLPKPTAHRMLGELAAWGAVERTADGYRLGLRMFLLGQRAPRQRELRRAALPFLEELYEGTHENVHLAVPDAGDTLFLAKVSGRDSTPIESGEGLRMPAYCTATGKVFLADRPADQLATVLRGPLRRRTARTIVMPGMLLRDLSRTRRLGYGVNLCEAEDRVVAVAAPIRAADGSVLAALSVTGSARRIDPGRLAPAVMRAAGALTKTLPAE